MKLDLHCHSTCSDGVKDPEQLIEIANRENIDYIAITDHDSLEAIDIAHSVPGTIYIPGVELSVVSSLTGKEFHLLGLFPNADMSRLRPFRDVLAVKRRERVDRARLIIDRLNIHFNLGLDFTDFCRFMNINMQTNASEQAVARPHIADYLISKKLIHKRKDAFWRYLSDSSPAYVPFAEYQMDQAISDIKAAGGFSFIAHCMLFENDRLEEDIKHAFQHGLDGLEVYHAANSMKYEWIKSLSPVYTLGSDWHNEATIWPLGCPEGNSLMPESAKVALLRYMGLLTSRNGELEDAL